MKILIYTLIPLVFMLIGCSDQTEFSTNSWSPSQKVKYLNIRPSSLTFGAGDNLTQNVKVSSLSTPWRIEGKRSWITLSQSEGSADASVSITVTENTDPASSRNAIYHFSSSDSSYPYSKQLSFYQASHGYEVTVSQNTITASAASSKEAIAVSANAPWTCKADVTWLHVQSGDNRITVSWDEYTSSLSTDRIGHIDVSCGNAISTITVNQKPPYISSTTKNIDYEAEGGAYQVEVKSDVSWTASTSQSWINISPQRENVGDAILYVSATPNSSVSERKGNVYLSIGGKRLIQIPIAQKGLFFEVDKSSITFGQQATTANIEVNTNTTWQVVSKPDFIESITPSNGNSGRTGVSISVSENQGGDRSGSIVLGNPSVTGLTKTIAVSQTGYEFSVSETDVSLQAFVTRTHDISIATNANWTVESNAEWLHLSPTSGHGNDKVTVNADVNPSIKQRVAKVRISTNTNLSPVELNITQKGQSFTVSSENLSYTSKGGSSSITVISDCESFEVESFPSWLTKSDGNTTNNQSTRVSFIAPVYSGEQERQGEIIISLKNLPNEEKYERKINVVQYPPVQTIGKVSFDNDLDWSLGGNNNMSISVTGFGSDIDWNFK